MLGTLELVVGHLALDRCGCQRCRPAAGMGRQPGEQMLDGAADGGGESVRGKVGWSITGRRMTGRLGTDTAGRGRPEAAHWPVLRM
jgi:hypothetical protein